MERFEWIDFIVTSIGPHPASCRWKPGLKTTSSQTSGPLAPGQWGKCGPKTSLLKKLKCKPNPKTAVMKSMLNNTLRLCCGVILAISPASASAGIIVSIDNLALTTGGTSGFVNVKVSWVPVGAEPATVNIDYFFANLTILPVGTPTSLVAFKPYYDSIAAVYHNGDYQFAEGNYLFAGNSLAMDPLFPQHAGSVGGLNNTIFSGSDGRLDGGSDITLDGSTQKLLYRLELLATGTATGTEMFQLSFAPSPDSLFFENDGLTTIPFSLDSFGPQGQITVTQGATAVPEPATGVVLLLGTGILAWRRSRKCRHHLPRDEPSGLTHRKSYRRHLPELPDRGLC